MGTSPLLGAAISYIMFSTIHSNILIVPKPREAAFRMMPHYFGFTVGTSVTFMVRVGPRSIRMSMAAAVMMFIVAYAVSFLLSRADGPLSGYINIVAPEEAEKLRRESRI